MDELLEFLPFLLPLVLVQLALLAFSLYHVLTHKEYKRGNRVLWLVIVLVLSNFVGPILYFVLGKKDA